MPEVAAIASTGRQIGAGWWSLLLGNLDDRDRMVGNTARVRDFDPRLSFGPATAARYDDPPAATKRPRSTSWPSYR